MGGPIRKGRVSSVFFDVTLQTYTMNVFPNPEEHAILLHFSCGIVLPQGPGGQKGLLPVGTIKIPVGYTMGKEFGTEITEAIAGIEPPSKLQVVQDPAAAEHVAAQAAAAEALRSEPAS